MKIVSNQGKTGGLTLVELLVVLATLVVLAAILLPDFTGSHKAPFVVCMSNLKQVDLGFQMSASDNGGRFPIQRSVTNDGTMEFIYSDHVFPHFQKISSLLQRPMLLACPLDKTRSPATNWEALNDLDISYFLNADLSTNNPSHAILSGDRHLQADGKSVPPGLFILTTNLNMRWIPDVHDKWGNLAFVDGHVEASRPENLNSLVRSQPWATNRLCIP
jgi:prepilin-type processing-associated H-X9-DG protein